MTADLWRGLREWPWDEKQVPRPWPPHPEPALRGTVGDWLTEYGITTWPQAPEGFRLVQHLAEGYGQHSGTGRPLRKPTRSLVLAYLHRSTARGATAILHFQAGAKKDGSGSWRFAEGFRWDLCTCELDAPHLTFPPVRDASAEEIKALLNTPERTD